MKSDHRKHVLAALDAYSKKPGHDRNSLVVVSRLREHHDVDAAFKSVPEDKWDALIRDCIAAQDLMTQLQHAFEERKKVPAVRKNAPKQKTDPALGAKQPIAAMTPPKQVAALDKAIARLKNIQSVLDRHGLNGDAAMTPRKQVAALDKAITGLKNIQNVLDSQDLNSDGAGVSEALNVLAACLQFKAYCLAIERKVLPREHTLESARSRGIGWIKESVERLSGRPNHQAVMTLAEATFGLTEVTIDQVIKALKPAEVARRL